MAAKAHKGSKMRLRPRRHGKYTRCLAATAILMTGLLVGAKLTAQRRKKIVLSEFVIEGRVQKPQAFLLLQRQNLNFGGLELKKSFTPKILKSANKKPF